MNDIVGSPSMDASESKTFDGSAETAAAAAATATGELQLISFKLVFGQHFSHQQPIRVHFQVQQTKYMTQTFRIKDNVACSVIPVGVYKMSTLLGSPRKSSRKQQSNRVMFHGKPIKFDIYTTSALGYRGKKLGSCQLNVNAESGSIKLMTGEQCVCLPFDPAPNNGTTENGHMDISFKLCSMVTKEQRTAPSTPTTPFTPTTPSTPSTPTTLTTPRTNVLERKPQADLKLFKKLHPGVQCQLELKSFCIEFKKTYQGNKRVYIDFGIKNSIDMSTEADYRTESFAIRHNRAQTSHAMALKQMGTNLLTSPVTPKKWETSTMQQMTNSVIDIYSYSVPIRFDVHVHQQGVKRVLNDVSLGFLVLELKKVAHHNSIQTMALELYEYDCPDPIKQKKMHRGTAQITLQLHYAENLEDFWSPNSVRTQEHCRRTDPVLKTRMITNAQRNERESKAWTNVGTISDSATNIMKQLEPAIDLGLYVSALVQWKLHPWETVVLMVGWYLMASNIEYWPVVCPLFLFVYNKWFWTEHSSNDKNALNWKDKLKTEENQKKWGMLGDVATQIHGISLGVSSGHQMMCHVDMSHWFAVATVGVTVLVRLGIADECMAWGGVVAILSQQQHVKTSTEFLVEWVHRQRTHGLHGTMAFYVVTVSAVLAAVLGVVFVFWIFDATVLIEAVWECGRWAWDCIGLVLTILGVSGWVLVHVPVQRLLEQPDTSSIHLEWFVETRTRYIKQFWTTYASLVRQPPLWLKYIFGIDGVEGVEEEHRSGGGYNGSNGSNGSNNGTTSITPRVDHSTHRKGRIKKKRKVGKYLLVVLLCKIGMYKGYQKMAQYNADIALQAELLYVFAALDTNQDQGLSCDELFAGGYNGLSVLLKFDTKSPSNGLLSRAELTRTIATTTGSQSKTSSSSDPPPGPDFAALVVPGCCGPFTCVTSEKAQQSKEICLTQTEMDDVSKTTACWWLGNTPGCCGMGACTTAPAQQSASKCMSYEVNATSGGSNCHWARRNEHWQPKKTLFVVRCWVAVRDWVDLWWVPVWVWLNKYLSSDFNLGLTMLCGSLLLAVVFAIKGLVAFRQLVGKGKGRGTGRTGGARALQDRADDRKKDRFPVQVSNASGCCCVGFVKRVVGLIVVVGVGGYSWCRYNGMTHEDMFDAVDRWVRATELFMSYT